MQQAPSMTGLRALDAVVRTGSLSAAARELCVTPAAISHRLRDLEAQSGTPLVQRKAGRFVATAPGQRVLDALGDAFVRIKAAHATLTEDRCHDLRIVGSYSFAVLWLAPRLAHFQNRHPLVKIYLNPSHSPMEDAHADITILHAAEPPEPTGWFRLFADVCGAVVRPAHPILLEPCASLADVLRGNLVHIAHEKGPALGEFSWRNWAARHGLSGHAPGLGPTVPAEHLAVDLVLAHDTCALVSLTNAARLICDGQLRMIPGSEVATGCSYWARLHDNDNSIGNTARSFLDWVIEELGQTTAPDAQATP